MELSQKQHSHRQQQMQEKQELERAYFQNVTNQTNSLLEQDNAKFNAFA